MRSAADGELAGVLAGQGAVLDAPDGPALAHFFAGLLGWQVFGEDADGAAVAPSADAGYHLAFQTEPLYVRPVWPAVQGEPPQKVRVLLDPAGHRFPSHRQRRLMPTGVRARPVGRAPGTMATLAGVRIARFSSDGGEPRFGVIGEADGASVVAVLTGDPLYVGIELTGERRQLDDVRLLAPVIPRSKVVGIGRNYAAHASELGNDVPDQPLIFLKPNTSVVGPGDEIVRPAETEDLHYEGELAVVIGRICKDVDVPRVPDVVLGYTVANDVTARDLQKLDATWARGKGYDTFCPVGPWVETDLDIADLRITTSIGDDVRQDSRTSLMIFDVPTLVSYVSGIMTLLPGDLILTGTPAGVGPMLPGERVAVTVEGIGTLTNPVVAARG